MEQVKALRYLMERYPNSFVGFLDTVADVLRTVGQEWRDHAFSSQDKIASTWSAAFLEAAKSIEKIVVDMARIRDEHDAKFAAEAK